MKENLFTDQKNKRYYYWIDFLRWVAALGVVFTHYQTLFHETWKNNFDRSEERFKLGQITSLEFRQAQINLINSKTSLNNAKFDAKLIELQLLQLSGDIMNVKF